MVSIPFLICITEKTEKLSEAIFLFTFYIRLQNVSYEVPKTGDAKPAHPPPSARALDFSAYKAKLPSPRHDLHAASTTSRATELRKVVVTASCI